MNEKIFRAGGVELRVDERSFGGDGGPSVRVYGEAAGENIQLLRFDCFRNEPHYHYDPSGKNEHLHLDKASVPDPIAWTIEKLGNDLAAMIRTAGYRDIAYRVDQAAVARVLPEVESLMRGDS